MDYDVIIVGAGASGLMAAITAARQGSSVLVIEQKDKAGKKILATGNGKCNFTNLNQSPECYRSDDSAFAMKVLSCFDVQKTIQFFQELGIYPKNRDGYLYPNSEQASSIVQVLLMECARLKVHFAYSEAVTEIRKPDYTVVTRVIPVEAEKKRSSVEYQSKKQAVGNLSKIKPITYNKLPESPLTVNQYHGTKLILATGGCASPQLGSDGSGYTLARHFGHTIIKPLPALVQLKSPDKYLKTVSGVRTAARVTLLNDQKQLAEEAGELLFTDYGISGIPILQISRFAAKALDQGFKIHLKLDFLPEVSGAELINMIKLRIRQNPGKNIEELMIGLLNHKLSYIIIKEAGLDPYKNAQFVDEHEIISFAAKCKEFKMIISDTNSFENAQVSAGGVNTKEINPDTLESRLIKNLYITGELADVDGTCGGYNLQWAWSSGCVAGTAAGKKER